MLRHPILDMIVRHLDGLSTRYTLCPGAWRPSKVFDHPPNYFTIRNCGSEYQAPESDGTMAQDSVANFTQRSWFWLIALIIFLIFLYYYEPFETYLTGNIGGIHFSNVLFWFASLIAVFALVVSHWQSFRQHIIQSSSELNVSGLVYDTLQIAVLVAIILCAGAILQSVEMLAENMISQDGSAVGSIGRSFVSIVVLVLLSVLFYLIHHLIRAFRDGWQSRRPPPRPN